MYIRITDTPAETVTLVFEGREIHVRKGLSVAAALLENGITHFRDTPVSGEARAPFCMMGVCFDCLLVINDTANCQSCLTEVHDGMRISRQSGDGGDLLTPATSADGA